MRQLALLVLLVLGSAGPLAAQQAVPDRRLVVSEGVDFYGSDLGKIFDTTLQGCQNACLNDDACRAFTFNTRSNACFPKSDISDRVAYDGAISAVVLEADAGVLNRAAARAEELSFLSPGDIDGATDQARGLGALHPADSWAAEDLVVAARDMEAAGNLVGAVRAMGSAVSITDAPGDWLDYGRLAGILAEQSDEQRQSYFDRAVLAAINAYLRADAGSQRATILAQLASALERQGRGRDMIPALRLAQDLQPRDDAAAALEQAIAKYGFRITEHQVDSDAAAPRICATFSEPLVQSGVDYSPYIQMPDATFSADVSDSQLCLDGVSHGARYSVTFRAGLPAASGEALAEPVVLNLYVRDRAPSVRFPGRSYILPAAGQRVLPVVTVNADTVDLVLRRISDRNLLRAIQNDFFGAPMSPWEEETFATELAEEVWRGTGETQMELNQDVTTRLPIGDAAEALQPGIYTLNAAIPGADPYQTAPATQWFVVSDLGLTTMSGTDGLHVFVRSLASAAAKPGVAVQLLSRANAILAETKTDADGYARFDPGLTRGTAGSAPAMVTLREGERDFTFLPLTDPEFDLSDRGVEGRAPAGPVDMFLTTDRGAYRAGETIFATALTRDGKAEALAGLPVTAVLLRPDGVEYSRTLSTRAVEGGHVFALPVGHSAPRGTWRLNLHTDPDAEPLASETLLVEDFLPERIDFDLSLPEGAIRVTDRPPVSVEARYLFGAPAADLEIEGEVALDAATTLDGYPGYIFGRYDQPFERRIASLPQEAHTDAEGQAVVALDLPPAEDANRPLDATVVLRIAEGSGRPVERQLTRAVAPAGPVIGIRPDFDDVLPEGGEARFSVIGLDAAMQPMQMQVRWTINRIETRYQWYQNYGNWNWEPVTTRSRVASDVAELGADPVQVSAPVEWGHYEIKVERLGGDYTAAATDFYAGWYGGADTSMTPDVLDLSLDKPAYDPGDTATLRIVPRYPGKALVTVLSNRLIDMIAVDVTEGENIVTLPVTDEWGAGAYVTASVIRPMDVDAGRNPARSLGLSYAQVDPGEHRLEARFEMGAEAEPRKPMEVALKVEGVAPGETAHATIAAVDLGILNLTGFEAPDPAGHYFGQRRLGVGLRDVYGRLIDGMTGAMGAIRSGGDAAAQLRMQSPPPTEELVAYFSGPIEVGPDGMARTSFDLPSFNGTVRLMAVVWSRTGVGQASADVLVRDPVVVNASLPRFLAPGDRSRLLLEITHATGPVGSAALKISADGITLSGEVPGSIDLADGATQRVTVPVQADQVGLHEITVSLTTPAGEVLTKTLALPVQVNDPEIARTTRFDLAAGDTFIFDRNVFDGLHPGTGVATLAIGPLARFDTAGLLNALDRYPYGCTEQVTSRAMPLLYLDEVAVAMGLEQRDQLGRRIEEAVAEVLTNQSSNGSFGLWGPASGDFWLDAYVTDFLSRARAAGHEVPDAAFRMAMDSLRNRVNYAADFDAGGEDIAYALHVLAREGAASIGDLRYYADVKAEAFGTPLAVAQIGAALASYGDPVRSDAMFRRASAMLSGSAEDAGRGWREDYGTPLRDAAAVLTLAVESGSEAVDREALVNRVSGGVTQALSTQEQVWSLLATNAMIGTTVAGGITVDGAPAEMPVLRVTQDEARGVPVHFRNEGAADTFLTLTTFGVPDQPEPAGGNGYALERQYFSMEGEPVQPDAVPMGTRLVAVVTVRPFDAREARLIVNDPLPAGFEIDNPNLLRGGDIRALDWLELNAEARHSEFRQDRFIAQVDWGSEDPFRLAYIVRAVSPGGFHHPAASVEDMYRPEFRARTDAGRVTVTE